MMRAWVVPAVLSVALLMAGANKRHECREAEGWELVVTALISGCLDSAITTLIAAW